jgi:hypothetical protein
VSLSIAEAAGEAGFALYDLLELMVLMEEVENDCRAKRM